MKRWPAARAYVFGFIAVCIASVAGVAAVGAWGYAEYVGPGPLTAPMTIIVPRGHGLGVIGQRLARAGVITRPHIFTLGAKLSGHGRDLRAGEYRFPEQISPRDVVAMLAEGRVVVRRLTFAEGLTAAEILGKLAVGEGLSGAVPGDIPEGSLLPETYHYAHGDERAALVGRMRRDMAALVAELWAARDPETPLRTPAEAVILASIIEKETAFAAERPLIAGVFINRLRRGMRLQSDPTVAYGLAPEGLDRALTRSDLATETAYNTYVISGLPPGPICNPGRASIAAALNPEETKYLYFVADGSGGHVFARTLKEHNRNVQQWRRHQKNLQQTNKQTNQ